MAGKGKGSKNSAKKSQKNKEKSMTQHEKAGIIFPVGRIGRMLREANYTPRVGGTAAVAMAAIIEYVTQEIVELAGDFAKEDTRKRITPRHI